MNKTLIILLSLSLTVVGIYAYHQTNKVSDLEGDLTHLNNTFDIVVDKRINDAKRYVTDSLLKEFESRPPITIVKTKIKYKYDTIIDSILVYPTARQLEYITTELDRLYPGN